MPEPHLPPPRRFGETDRRFIGTAEFDRDTDGLNLAIAPASTFINHQTVGAEKGLSGDRLGQLVWKGKPAGSIV